MIGYLQGTLKEKNPPKLLLLLSHGIGYELETPLSTFERLNENQSSIAFYTHLIPREDALLLYGFLTSQERDLFRTLIKINHVGPKLALAILSHMSVSHFVECITFQDYTRLNRIPGLGKKTTERLIIEMKDRLDLFPKINIDYSQTQSNPAASAIQEALNALSTLGYKPLEAQRLLSHVKTPCETVEEWIRAALKEASL
jgi:Holliday junction DNA helicase RuvA